MLYGMIEGEERPTGHPVEVVDGLGIKYKLAAPQTVFDAWVFLCCENVPNPLPPYLTEINIGPADMVGFGLSEDEVKTIS